MLFLGLILRDVFEVINSDASFSLNLHLYTDSKHFNIYDFCCIEILGAQTGIQSCNQASYVARAIDLFQTSCGK